MLREQDAQKSTSTTASGERPAPRGRYSLGKRIAAAATGIVLAGSLTACGENASATPEDTSTAPTATASLEPAPTTAETETPTTEAVELLPNGEERLSPAQLVELREQGGDAAVTEYFTPTLAKLGMTYDEVMADPAEFGNRFAALHSSLTELMCNLSQAMPDKLDALDEDEFVAEVGTWIEPTLVYTSKVRQGEDMYRAAIESAASRQWATHLVEPDTLNTYTISVAEGQDVQTTSYGNNGNFMLLISEHTQDNSILGPYIGPKGEPIDAVNAGSINLYVSRDGIITVQ